MFTPISLTALGRKELYDQIDDMSVEATERQLDWARDNAERGVRPPRYAYEFVMDASGDLISGQPFDNDEKDSALWRDAQTKVVR